MLLRRNNPRKDIKEVEAAESASTTDGLISDDDLRMIACSAAHCRASALCSWQGRSSTAHAQGRCLGNSRMCAPESVFSTRSVVGLHPRGLVRWRKPQVCARSWRAAAKMRRSRSDDPWRYAGLHPVPPRAWKIQREKMQKARAACLARPRVRRSGSGRARSARPTRRSGSRGSRPS